MICPALPLPEWFRPWLDGEFGRVYRQAVSRLCVSPFMCEAYRERYGAEGTVLYPSRAADCPSFDAPPERIARNDHPFTVAFGGTINSPGYVNALVNLASALALIGGRLFIFGPVTPEAARQAGLERPNIVLRGLVKSSDFMTRLREEADALVCADVLRGSRSPQHGDQFSKQAHRLYGCWFAVAHIWPSLLFGCEMGARKPRSRRGSD